MRITIVNPPSPPKSISNRDTMGGFGQLYSRLFGRSIIPVIDIAYVAAVLRRKAFDVNVMDAVALDLNSEELVAALARERPQVIAIRVSTPTIRSDLVLTHKIKQAMPSANIWLYGPHVSFYTRSLEVSAADGLVVGEPESTFPELAEAMRSGVGFETVAGLCIRGKGGVLQTGRRRLEEDLDSLPFPAWDLMPIEKYSSPYVPAKPFLTILTSRGCPYGCIYCPYPVSQGTKWRARTAENVIAELSWLTHDLGVKGLLFRDPTFTLDQERAKKICIGIRERKLDVIWRCETRPDCLTEELLREMAQANCIGINLGIESGCEQTLKRLGRSPNTLDQAKKVRKWSKECGLSLYAFFIIGLPGEDKASVGRTVQMAKTLDPEFVQFTIATPYPGTELYRWARSRGFVLRDWDLATGYTSIMRTENFEPDELESLLRKAYFAYYANPKRWLRLFTLMGANYD